MSSDILDQIDHVLADYDTGPDAMRWTPEEQPAPTRMTLGPALLAGDIGDWEPVTSRLQGLTSGTLVLEGWFDVEPTWFFYRPVRWRHRKTSRLRSTVRGPGIRRRPLESGLEYLSRAAHHLHSHPEPLAVDGDAYRRRQKARRRRNR